MAKLLLCHDDGTIEEKRIPDKKSLKDVFFEDDYIAIKRWTREDIAQELIENSIPDIVKNVDAVINQGLGALNQCSDTDWNIIGHAIYEAKKNGNIKGNFSIIGDTPREIISNLLCENELIASYRFEGDTTTYYAVDGYVDGYSMEGNIPGAIADTIKRLKEAGADDKLIEKITGIETYAVDSN